MTTKTKIHMSPTRAFNFADNPLRALEDYLEETAWFEGDPSSMFYGTIVHNIAEGRDLLADFTDDEKQKVISSRGATQGQLKANFKEAGIVGDHLRKFVMAIAKDTDVTFETEIKEPNEVIVDGDPIPFNVTGRADMLTGNAVYDFKTVAPNDFQGFLEYGSFRDHREVNYLRQIAFYAHMFDKEEAHILYIQKQKDKPFIYDYQLTENDLYEGWQSIVELITKAVTVIAKGKEYAKAVNDGSIWAFKHFGGVITNDSQND